MSDLTAFFDTQKKQAKKKKKKTTAASAAIPNQAEVEKTKESENPALHTANVDDFEEDEEQKTEDLMSSNANIKDMTEVQQAKKREQEKNQTKDWAVNLQQQPTAKAATKDAAPKAKKTFDASSAFGGGGRPTFSKKSGTVGGSNKDFPAMGDFPTLGSDGKSESKKESGQMASKSD